MFKSFWLKTIKSKSSVFFYCIILFVAGIFSGYFLILPHFIIFIIFLILSLAIIILIAQSKYNFCFFVLMFLCSFVFGLWRYELTQPNFNDAGNIYHYSSSTVSFIGQIKNIDSRIDGHKITVQTQLLQDKKNYQSVSGLVLISQPLYPQFTIQEKVKVDCFLEKPGMIETFDYGRYLANQNIFAVCAFATVSEIKPADDFSPIVLFFRFKQYLTRQLNAAISEPEVALMRGILLGDGRGLPPDQTQIFSDLGLTHIIAISGDHIAIVAVALLQLMIAFGISRPKAYWPLAIIITLYVALVGAPASAVRAAIMALAVMYAQKIGRTSQIKNVLALAAGAMIMFNPRILLGDVGFQLSFMAIWGLSYISPLISARLQKLPDFFRTKEILIATLSAQFATLPLLMFYFGKLSIISVLANILILPVIPFLTIWGLLNLFVAAIFLPLGRLMGYVTWLLCFYWLKVSDLLHQVPYGYFILGNFGLLYLIILYAIIFAGYFFFSRRKSEARSVLALLD